MFLPGFELILALIVPSEPQAVEDRLPMPTRGIRYDRIDALFIHRPPLEFRIIRIVDGMVDLPV